MPCLVYGQQTINGIGVLKFGMTKSDLFEKIDNNQISKLDSQKVPKLKGAVGYLLDDFVPAKGIDMRKIELLFYNDSLYSIYTKEYSPIATALTLKYGDPEITGKEELKKVTNVYGKSSEKKDNSTTNRWNTGSEDVECVEMLGTYHTSEGSAIAIYSFTLRDKVMMENVKRLEKEERKIEKEIEKENKLKGLEGF